MAEYLEKSKMKQYVKNFFTGLKVDGDKFDEEDCCETICQIIDFAPAADVVEVKHGKWYRHDKKIHGDTCYHCSQCEKMPLTDCGMVWELTPYCPFCGEKMDGEHNEK